jgi:hypothetical protein
MVLEGKLDDLLAESVRDAFAGKKTATLVSRGSALLKYLLWHRKQTGYAGLPLREYLAYQYVKQLESTGAPTAPGTFISAVNFGLYTLGMEGAAEVTKSARIVGVVFACNKRKRPKEQSRVLEVDEVKSLEYQGLKSLCNFDRYASLFFVNQLYTRSRYTALCLASCVIADLDSEFHGFIESQTLHAKIRADAPKANSLLPLVAPAVGVSGTLWGKAFLDERARQGLDKFSYLLPTPGVSGDWIDEPLGVGAAGKWLRDLLLNSGHREVSTVGTHSLKATCLSWAAKWGSPIEIRSLLGYHVAREITTTLTYSRDAQSSPLRELIVIITAIAKGEFFPDDSRSGRIVGDAKKRRDPKDPSIVTLRRTVDIPCLSDPYDPLNIRLPSSPDSSSTSSSSSSESSEASSIDNEELDLIAKPRVTDESFEGKVAYVHKTSAVLHCRLDDHTRLKCGRMLTVTYSKIKWIDTSRILRCAQCFRS